MHAYKHMHAHVCMHVCAHAHSCMCVPMHANIHVHVHTHTHTYADWGCPMGSKLSDTREPPGQNPNFPNKEPEGPRHIV